MKALNIVGYALGAAALAAVGHVTYRLVTGRAVLLSTDPVERGDDDIDVARVYNPSTRQFRVMSNTSFGVANDVQSDLGQVETPRPTTGRYREALTYVLADRTEGETN